MAFDKVVDSAALDAEMTATAAAIREKGGTTTAIQWVDGLGFANAVKSLPTSAVGYELVKVASVTVSYTAVTVDLTGYPRWKELTANDILLNPKNFIVFETGGATSGNITCGTYAFNKTYNSSTGKLSLFRASVKGNVGINFDCDVYVALEVDSDYVDGLIVDALEAIENGAY